MRIIVKNKRIFSGLLLVFVLLPAIAFILLQWQVAQCKIRMRSELEKHSLVTIVIPANKIQWKDGRKEVLIGRRMFDVKRYFLNNQNQFVVTGLFDDQETQLISLIHNSKNKAGHRQTKLIASWLNWQLMHHSNGYYQPKIQPSNTSYNSALPILNKDPYSDVLCPPPWS